MSEISDDKSEEKSEKSVRIARTESRKPRSKPPFKLCFVLREEKGRSYILPSRPKKIPCGVILSKMFGEMGRRFDPRDFGKLGEIARHDERTKMTDFPFNPRIDPFASIPILAPKFYSRHDCTELEHPDPQIMKELIELREIGPKEKYEEPVTESQRYGWYVAPEFDCDRKDRRLNFAKQTSDMVKLKVLIDHADAVTKSKRT